MPAGMLFFYHVRTGKKKGEQFLGFFETMTGLSIKLPLLFLNSHIAMELHKSGTKNGILNFNTCTFNFHHLNLAFLQSNKVYAIESRSF